MAQGIYSGSRLRIQEEQKEPEFRLRLIFVGCAAMSLAIVVRLFYIMIIQHGLYTALAAGTQ